MGHGKETPRQKMIGMMYLVLTALLAMNVSAEILNAFVLIDESLRKSADNIDKKSDGIYLKFEEAMQDPKSRAKTEPLKKEADSVAARTARLYNYVDSLKKEVVLIAEGPGSKYIASGGDVHKLEEKKNLDVGGQVMIFEGKGMLLKKMIKGYDSSLVDMIVRKAPKGDTSKFRELIKGIHSTLSTDSIQGQERMVAWEYGYFDQLPIAAVLAMMSKVQTDIRNAEADALNFLISQIDAASFKFNKLEAIVKSESNYVLLNNEYKAQVFIAASDSTTKPDIYLTGSTTPLPVENGKGIYNGATNSIGMKPWGGVIKMIHPASGEELQFPFKAEYQVAEPSLVVSPTKMNVFYIGVDNPVDISVSGVRPEDVTGYMTGGGGVISKVNGNSYNVKVTTVTNDAFVGANANVNGKAQNMGQKKFRVKRVPDPVPMVGTYKGGAVAKNELIALGGVKAVLENFDFDLRFDIISFKMSATVGGYVVDKAATGPRFTSEQSALVSGLKVGQKVYIEEIVARGPDGSNRNLPALAFVLR